MEQAQTPTPDPRKQIRKLRQEIRVLRKEVKRLRTVIYGVILGVAADIIALLGGKIGGE